MSQSEGHSIRRVRGFALVLALVMVAMLATTSVGLGMLVSTESIRSAALSRDLDHQLALDSLLALLPDLLAENQAIPQPHPDDGRHIAMDVGQVHIECDVRPERGKLKLSDRSGGSADSPKLLELARANKLPEGDVLLRPVMETDETREWPKYLWFDQLVTPRGFEETFPWRWPDDKDPLSPQTRTWSDLLSFWGAGAGTRSLQVTTSVKADIRRWYLVVESSENGVRTLYRGAI